MWLKARITQAFGLVNPEDLEKECRQSAGMVMKQVLEREMHNRIDRYLDDLGRKSSFPNDRRNGHYRRRLLTQLGTLELSVPRTRRTSGLKLIGGLARREKSVDKLILACFCLGLSTRKVAKTLLQVTGVQVSPALVSEVCKCLDAEVMRFHNRPLKDRFQVLIFDGIAMKEKTPVGLRDRIVLVAMGLRSDGTRELIDFHLSEKGESQNGWEKFLGMLYHRGLTGEITKVIVTDGNSGLLAAADLFYPGALSQRCWAHKARNVLDEVKRPDRKAVARDLRKVHNAKTQPKADAALKNFITKWAGLYPKAVKCLVKDLDNLFHFRRLAPELWKPTKTTNYLERAFEEVRRRTKIMGVFKNRQSLERILFSVFYFYNQNQVPLFTLTQNT